LKAGSYLRIDPKIACGPFCAESACRLLWITEGRLDPVPPVSPSPESVTFTDSTSLEWQIPWVKGPAPGLRLKLLWRDEQSGAYSRLLSVDPGWREPRLEHHDCSEEAFVLEGDMTMGSLGTMRPGAYFWRPPGIKHGPMHSSSGALILIRTDGALFNYYTAADGTPLNYTA
jgi:quercetin dioxygenase-like cupin family protein